MKRLGVFVPNVRSAAPGQRVRVELWAKHLESSGWRVDFFPFESPALHRILYSPGHRVRKAVLLAACCWRQLSRAMRARSFDVLLVHREAALIGPAFLERLLVRTGLPVVYDVDDPVFVPYRSPANGWYSLLKCPRKTDAILRRSRHVIAVNGLIAAYARQYNPSVSVIPNTVDTEVFRPGPERPKPEPVLVWMGSYSTMGNLGSVAGPLRRAAGATKFRLRVIGAGGVALPDVQTEVRQWSAEAEVPDLQDCDIGLVPMPASPWNAWKFFYKTVQYMSVGLAVVAQRMGSNADIVCDGENGFLVSTQQEWYDRIRELLDNPALRARLGRAARETACARFSHSVHMPEVVALFERLAARSPAPAGVPG